MTPITYPARPLNGGSFGLITRKPVHLWSTKLNGWRALVHTPSGTMFNRQGEELTIAGEFHGALEHLSSTGFEWLDCEALERRHNIGRGSLIILDAVASDFTASERHTLLVKEAAHCEWGHLGVGQRPEENRVYLLRQDVMSDASPSGNKHLARLWHWMQQINKDWNAEFYEGLVAKRADSPYPIQLRSPKAETPFWIKHRWA